MSPAALGTTITPSVLSRALASPRDDFLIVDEHAAQSDSLPAGDHVVALLPAGEKVRTVIAAVVARGLHGNDTSVSASLTGAVMPSQVYLDSTTGAGRPLDERRRPR
ncbi:hypothetical protein [Streptomyces sp. NPDC001135]